MASEDVVPEDMASEEIAPEDLASREMASEAMAPEDLASRDMASEAMAPEDLASEEVVPEDAACAWSAVACAGVLPPVALNGCTVAHAAAANRQMMRRMFIFSDAAVALTP